MCKQTYSPANTLCDRDIQRPTAEIEHKKHAVAISLLHDTHDSRNGFLHQRNTAQTGHFRGSQRGILLHLIESCRDGNYCPGFPTISNLFRQISEAELEDFGGTLLGSHCYVDSSELDRSTRPHHAFEFSSSVVGVFCCAIVGSLAQIFIAPPINENGRWRYVILIRALIEAHRLSVIGANRAICCSKIDSNVFHACTFLSITVPCFRKPSGPMMMGSTI